MYCPKCGTNCKEGMTYCMKCGAKLSTQKKSENAGKGGRINWVTDRNFVQQNN